MWKSGRLANERDLVSLKHALILSAPLIKTPEAAERAYKEVITYSVLIINL